VILPKLESPPIESPHLEALYVLAGVREIELAPCRIRIAGAIVAEKKR
jgi:hypothetical protein